MKKFAKLSLVAAVAVAGFAQTASAKDLSEAIKGVDVSGSVAYRYDEKSVEVNGGENTHTTSNTYKVVTKLSAPVNEDVKFNSSIVVNEAAAPFSTINTADSGVNVQLNKANFAYTGVNNLTVVAGKQGLNTPWTCGSHPLFNEQTGTGLLALYNAGPATIAGGYYNQTNLNLAGDGVPSFDLDLDPATANTPLLNGSEDIMVLAAMGSVGPVALDAWYLNLAGADIDLDTITLAANYSAKFGDVKFGAGIRYATLDVDEQGANDDSTDFLKLMVSAKMGIFSGKLGYATTNDGKGGEAGVIAFDKHTKVSMMGWGTNINGKNNADFIKLVLGVDALPNLNVSFNYNTIEYGAGDLGAEENEMYLQGVYKMSKNFSTTVRLGNGDTKASSAASSVDYTNGRLQLLYKF